MIHELSLAVLNRNIPEHSLIAGDVGTVIHVYPDAAAYEVEFVIGLKRTIAALTLLPNEIRPLAAEILHVRSVAQSA